MRMFRLYVILSLKSAVLPDIITDRNTVNSKKIMPIASEGWVFILPTLLLGSLLLFVPLVIVKIVAILTLIISAYCIYFFRDPERDIPQTTDLIAPGDGVILEVKEIDGEGYGKGKVIRIFLSLFSVHVQRSPIAGTVVSVTHKKGEFLDARHPEAPFKNEAVSLELDTVIGKVIVRQLAGLIARRILCWVNKGDALKLGDRYGLIRFGSQVDLFVPISTEILVKTGDKVTAGITPLARPATNKGAAQ